MEQVSIKQLLIQLMLFLRSATLVLAYLMKYHNLPLIEAHSLVKSKRKMIRPNDGFWQQLIEYEKKLFGKNTVTMVVTNFGNYAKWGHFFKYSTFLRNEI